MDTGGFYAGRAYASSRSPFTTYASAYPDASKLDQIVALIQAQSQETEERTLKYGYPVSKVVPQRIVNLLCFVNTRSFAGAPFIYIYGR